MRNIIAIVIGLTALPALAAAQEDESSEPEVVFVDHSEVDIVVEEEGTEGTPFVEQQGEAGTGTQTQAAPPPPTAQGQVQLTVPAPPVVQLDPEVQQRQLLRARLSEYSLGGPIAMLAVGFPLALIFTYAAYVAHRTESIVGCAVDCSEEPNRTATAVLGTIAGAGLVLGVVGLITLVVRVGHRSRIRREVHEGGLSFFDDGALMRF